jgi:hypothetical protein
VGKARTSGGGIAKRALVLLTLCVLFAVGVGTAAASGNGGGNGNGNGKPGSPPGQGECEHGNSGKPCRDDPQPEHGKDCQAHGNQGGVNEDHCGGVTTPEPPPPPTTVNQPPPPTTTVTTTTTATTTATQTTTSAPSSPSPPPTTTKTSPPEKPEPKQEDPREQRAPSATPPKATTPKPNDAPAKAKHETAEPKQEVKAAAAPAAENVDAGCAPPRVLAVAPKTAEGRLPFTGLPLWVFVLGGLAVLLAGVGVRRLARAGRDAAE